MIKRILIAAILWPLVALAQSYPSPTFQNLTVLGTLTPGTISGGTYTGSTFTSPTINGGTVTGAAISGGTISGLSSPLAVASGGTGSATASGTALDNITGFNSTGFMSRGGAGSYSFSSRINLTSLANQAANTVVANVTSGSTTPTAFAMPTCSTSSSAVNYTTNTGFGCNTAINAAQLGGATFAAPGPIGSTTASTGAFTTLTATTPATGNSSTNVATTAFVANHAPCLSILDYGGNNGGSVDNSTAWANILAAQTGNQTCVYFPPGVYDFASTISKTLPASTLASITIMGAGTGVTELYFPTATSGITISEQSQYNSFHIKDLTITTGTVGATGSAVSISQTGTLGASNNSTEQSDFTNVNIRGHDGPDQFDYWATGITATSASVINFNNVKLDGQYKSGILTGGYVNSGTGIYLVGSSSIIPVQFNFVNLNITYYGIGINFGTYVQGVQMVNSNITGGSYGIESLSGTTGLSELTVIGSQFNVYANSILTQIPIGPTTIMGTNFYVPEANSGGIVLTETEGCMIEGNWFFGNTAITTSAQYGIVIGQVLNNGGCVVSGNGFENLIGTGSVGVLLQAASTNINVQANYYKNNATNVSNSGTGNSVGVATQ